MAINQLQTLFWLMIQAYESPSCWFGMAGMKAGVGRWDIMPSMANIDRELNVGPGDKFSEFNHTGILTPARLNFLVILLKNCHLVRAQHTNCESTGAIFFANTAEGIFALTGWWHNTSGHGSPAEMSVSPLGTLNLWSRV